jgi:RNA polymerase sigma-70 factor (ECF subfamily)
MDGRSFEAFYRASFPKVLAATRAFCGEHHLAHDATQESFARAFVRWRKLRDQAWVEGWVVTTAMNYCRKNAASASPITLDASFELSRDDHLDLLSALRNLPDRQRQAAVLHYIVDCSIVTVASLMDLSEGGVKAHLFKARKALRTSMEVGHV